MVLNPFTRRDLARIRLWVSIIRSAADEFTFDRYIIAALVLRESGGGFAKGYWPRGSATGWGDRGFGFGLFQIDRRFHAPFVYSEQAKFPLSQARYACDLLATNRRRLELRFPGLGPEGLLHGALCAYNAGLARVRRALRDKRNPDEVTTGSDYGSWVIAKAAKLRAAEPTLFDTGDMH